MDVEKQLNEIAQELWMHRDRPGSAPDQVDRERAERILNKVDLSEDNSLQCRELYKILRDYVVHEDNLINNRLGWLLTSQGLLFSAFALSLDKNTKSIDVGILHISIFLVGIVMGIISFTIVLQARLAIEGLHSIWNEVRSFSDKSDYPRLTGGLKSGTNRNIFCIALSWLVVLIPLAFVGAWVAILLSYSGMHPQAEMENLLGPSSVSPSLSNPG